MAAAVEQGAGCAWCENCEHGIKLNTAPGVRSEPAGSSRTKKDSSKRTARWRSGARLESGESMREPGVPVRAGGGEL